VYVKYPDGRTTNLSSAAGGKICSNFTAEIKAITETADHLVNSDTHGNVVILTDSLSTLLVLSSNNSDEVVYQRHTTVDSSTLWHSRQWESRCSS
jgi:hypothetical protein